GPFGSHQPHGCRGDIVGKAAAIYGEPVTLGEVEEHGRVATARVHSPGRRTRLRPSLLKEVPALDAAYSILAIENVVRAAILGQDRIDAGHCLMPSTCLLAAGAITNASQNWSPDNLELYFAAAARRRGELIGHFASSSIYARTRGAAALATMAQQSC